MLFQIIQVIRYGVMKVLVEESVKDPAVKELIFASNIKYLLKL